MANYLLIDPTSARDYWIHDQAIHSKIIKTQSQLCKISIPNYAVRNSDATHKQQCPHRTGYQVLIQAASTAPLSAFTPKIHANSRPPASPSSSIDRPPHLQLAPALLQYTNESLRQIRPRRDQTKLIRAFALPQQQHYTTASSSICCLSGSRSQCGFCCEQSARARCQCARDPMQTAHQPRQYWTTRIVPQSHGEARERERERAGFLTRSSFSRLGLDCN